MQFAQLEFDFLIQVIKSSSFTQIIESGVIFPDLFINMRVRKSDSSHRINYTTARLTLQTLERTLQTDKMFLAAGPFVPLLAVVFAALNEVSRTDASPHFEMQESGVTANLRGISAVSDAVVWASGENGTIVRTLDGGEHWEKVLHRLQSIAVLDFRSSDVHKFGKSSTTRLRDPTEANSAT